MPVLGLGVWQMAAGGETEQAVEWALEAGYRHIDTASVYRNEQSVGRRARAERPAARAGVRDDQADARASEAPRGSLTRAWSG